MGDPPLAGWMMRRWPKPLVREGIWTIVFTTINAEPTPWDAILPAVALRLPAGLAEIDRLLDDPRFFEPFRPFFDPRRGRPSIPMETYLRMMFLRFRYELACETLCAEVSDSIAWRRFCRIPLGTAVPHSTTLIKITSPLRDSGGRRAKRSPVGRSGRV